MLFFDDVLKNCINCQLQLENISISEAAIIIFFLFA